MNKAIKGTGVALVTPFHANGNIDFKSLDALVKHLRKGKVDFLVALGTTAETATLNTSEKSAVLSAIIESNENELPIVVGMGSNNTRQLTSEIQQMDFTGIDGILSVAPYYNKPNQKGIYSHFREVALSTDLPIIIYNVPGRTCSNILPDTCLKLANDFDNIIAIKEASGNFFQMMDIVKARPKGFKIFSGDDALTQPMMAAGADGVISVLANAYPAAMAQMVNLMLANKTAEAQVIHYQMYDIINALFADGNPGGVKALLEHLGIMSNNLRLPLVKVNRALNLELKKLSELSLLK